MRWRGSDVLKNGSANLLVYESRGHVSGEEMLTALCKCGWSVWIYVNGLDSEGARAKLSTRVKHECLGDEVYWTDGDIEDGCGCEEPIGSASCEAGAFGPV